MNIIETYHLTKEYADFTAVTDLNMHIRQGVSMDSWDQTERENPPQ